MRGSNPPAQDESLLTSPEVQWDKLYGASVQNRTVVLCLEGTSSTIELQKQCIY